MAVTVRDLLVRIGVDAEGADTEVASLDGAISDLTDVMAGAIAVAAAFTAAIVGVASSAANAADTVGKAAIRTSLGTEAYQELAFAASQAGLEVGAFEQAIAKQVDAMGAVADGVGPAAEGYEKLAGRIGDITKMNAEEAFKATADAIKGVDDETQQLAIAIDIFGVKLAGKLMPLLQGGAAGMEEMAARAHELGFVMSEEQTVAGALWVDTLEQLQLVLVGIKNAIGLALLPTLTDLLIRMRDWSIANRDFIADRLDLVIGGIVGSVQSLMRAFELADSVVQRTVGGWEPIFVALAAVVGIAAAAVTAFAGLKAWAAIQTITAAIMTFGVAAFAEVIAVILAAAAAVILLGLVIDDLIVFFTGGDSALGRFLDTFRGTTGLIGTMVGGFDTLIAIASRLWDIMVGLGGAFWEVFARTGLPLLKLLGAVVMWLAETAFGMLGWYLENAILPVWDLILLGLDLMIEKLAFLTPMLDAFLEAMDTALALASQLTGVDLTVDSSSGSAGPTAGVSGALFGDADTSSLFGPTAGEALGAGGFAASLAAPPAARGGATMTVQGNTYNINGVGLTEPQVQEIVTNNERERARATSAALEGGEV